MLFFNVKKTKEIFFPVDILIFSKGKNQEIDDNLI